MDYHKDMEQDNLGNLEISKDLHLSLMGMAEQDGVSPSDLAENILQAHIARQADYAEDDRRWQEYKRTGEHLTHEEFLAFLDELVEESRQAAKNQGSK